MYVNISKIEIAKLLKVKDLSYLGRSANGDFIFDVRWYRIRVNFSLTEWSSWWID